MRKTNHCCQTRRNLLKTSVALTSTLPVQLLAQSDETPDETPFECITEIPPRVAGFNAQSARTKLISDLEEEEAPPRIASMGLQGVAHASYRWRPSDGLQAPAGRIRLGIAFAGSPEQSWKKEVQSRAKKWVTPGTKLASIIEFVFIDSVAEAQIIVGKAGRGGLTLANKSFIGRLALNGKLEDGVSTMVINDLSSTEHEFGHALCLGHEHKHEALPVKIDREKAIAYYRKHHMWSRQKTIDNVLTSGERCAGDGAFNPQSCMIYPIPPEILEEVNFEYFRYTSIHERDRECLDAIYGA